MVYRLGSGDRCPEAIDLDFLDGKFGQHLLSRDGSIISYLRHHWYGKRGLHGRGVAQIHGQTFLGDESERSMGKEVSPISQGERQMGLNRYVGVYEISR